MRALALTRYLPVEDPQVFDLVTLPDPVPAVGELLVRVCASAVNPIDAKLRAPRPQVESEPRILGWDAAGEVLAVGEGVEGFAVGDAVFYAGALNRPGSNAERQCVDARLVAHMPGTLDFAQAAALPLTSLTAWELLFDSMGVPLMQPEANRGKTLLVINGAGGVGSMLIQLACWAGLTVVATASRSESVDWCRQMGADAVVNWRDGLQAACVQAGYDGFDYIACLSDNEAYWQDMAALIRPFGAVGLVVSAREPLDINPFKNKCARLCWEFMFARSQLGQQAQQGNILAEVAALVDIGVLQPTLTHTLVGMTVDNLRALHAQIETGRTLGKWVMLHEG